MTIRRMDGRNSCGKWGARSWAVEIARWPPRAGSSKEKKRRRRKKGIDKKRKVSKHRRRLKRNTALQALWSQSQLSRSGSRSYKSGAWASSKMGITSRTIRHAGPATPQVRPEPESSDTLATT